MKKSQLIRVLQTFSKKDVREMRKWVCSPAHNQREDVVLLFEYLTEKGRLEDAEALQKEVTYTNIYNGEQYNDAKIRQVMFFLMKVVEEYLVFTDTMEEEAKIKLALAKAYRSRKLDKLFLKQLETSRTLNEKQAYRNEQYYREEYLIEQERYRFMSQQKRLAEMNLQEVADALDITYIADKLRQSCLMVSHQAVYKTEYEVGMIDQILAYIESNNLLEIPAIAIYYYIYKTLTVRNEEFYFQNLKQQIFENGKYFPVVEIRDVYLLAINYCIRRLNAGVEKYIQESFELYRKGFEDKILIENERITRFTFRNVIAIALKLEQYDWVEHFIEQYQHYLADKYREGIVKFNKAILQYSKKDYNSAQQLLSTAEFKDIILNLEAKRMLLKMFYEQGEYDVLDSNIDSMSAYLRRKKEIDQKRVSYYKNYIRLIKKLISLNPSSKASKEKLMKDIQEVNSLFSSDREWLLEQLEDL